MINKYNNPVYLIRLDDAHSRMHHEKWHRIERILEKYNIKAMVAVIPYNQDKKIYFDKEDFNFWDKVKKWEEKGWTICLHGYTHVYETSNKGIIPLNNYSEFAGLPLEKQREKIKKAWQIFINKGIKPKVFAAPAHTFDVNTLKALELETNIRIISDGLTFRPYYYKNFYFIPAQLWKFKKWPIGTWTITFHPSTMKEKHFQALEQTLNKYYFLFKDFNELNLSQRKFNIIDFIFEKFLLFKISIEKSIWLLLNKF